MQTLLFQVLVITLKLMLTVKEILYVMIYYLPLICMIQVVMQMDGMEIHSKLLTG